MPCIELVYKITPQSIDYTGEFRDTPRVSIDFFIAISGAGLTMLFRYVIALRAKVFDSKEVVASYDVENSGYNQVLRDYNVRNMADSSSQLIRLLGVELRSHPQKMV